MSMRKINRFLGSCIRVIILICFFLLLCWLFFVPSHPQITILPLKWRFNNYRIYMLSTLV